MSDVLLVETLLYEAEGSELDFKEQQYPFIGAADMQKAELLKDVLAFANAWRRADAYILLGVREVKGGRSDILGVSHHIDDAALQQFVNAKTQSPVELSYRGVECEGKQVGLIHVALQRRPIYLVKDFGCLKANTVYLRRGSATDVAKPDEIARMGASHFPGAESRVRLRPVLSVSPPSATNEHLHKLQISVRNETAVVPSEIRVDIHVPAAFVLPNTLDQMNGPVSDGYKRASKDKSWFPPLFKDDSERLWNLSFRIPPGTDAFDSRLQMPLRIIVNASGMEPYQQEAALAQVLGYTNSAA